MTPPTQAPTGPGPGAYDGQDGVGATSDPVVLRSSRAGRAVEDAALVLASIGIPFEVVADGAGTRLLVSVQWSERASHALAAYDAENVGWPPLEVRVRRRSDGVVGAAYFTFVVVLTHAMALYGSFGADWTEAGRLEVARVRAGEWERLVTALTLHVDLTHLASNLVFGVVFGVLAAHVLGGGLTWCAAVFAGGLGNGLNTLVQAPHHRSIGASTAVFALLGLLAAYEWTRRRVGKEARLRRVAPLIGAVVLLGWLGVGETERPARVDVFAHVFGLAAGALAGALAALGRWPERLRARGQVTLGALAAAAIEVAWWRALAR